jgi:hypothetical protein
MTVFVVCQQYGYTSGMIEYWLLFIATQKKINKHTDQLISVNALGLAHKTIQFYAIKFVQKYYQP